MCVGNLFKQMSKQYFMTITFSNHLKGTLTERHFQINNYITAVVVNVHTEDIPCTILELSQHGVQCYTHWTKSVNDFFRDRSQYTLFKILLRVFFSFYIIR